MRRPSRETVRGTGQAYFVSSQTEGRRPFFRNERWSLLLQEVLGHYRGNSYHLHAYVIMPDHFHLILSPQSSLERAMQNIKGGFSFRARKAFDWRGDIWQAGFSDHRIRDVQDWNRHIAYIRKNPVEAEICLSSGEYRYLALDLDPIPQRLKPLLAGEFDGGAEAPPLQPQRLKPLVACGREEGIQSSPLLAEVDGGVLELPVRKPVEKTEAGVTISLNRAK